MNILYLEDVTQKMTGVTYYRMVVPGKALDDLGHRVKFSAELLGVDKNGENPKIIVDDLDWADVVVFPRYFAFSPNVIVSIMNYAKSQGKKVVYETDDCLYQIPEHNPVAKFVNQPSTQMMIKFLEEKADVKTVTTKPLKEILDDGRDNIILCPNSIDLSMWDVENKKTDKLIIGWAGGWTHKKDLEMLLPVLRDLKKKYKFELHLFGYDPELKKTQLYYKSSKWANVLEYPEVLASKGFDIGIAPLVDDEFNQFKSNIKWLEYSMLGIPTVASNLPPYQDIIDGVDGFLCSNLDEWATALEKLITDAQVRSQIGSAAKKRVTEEYDIKKTIGNWVKAYE